MADTIREFVARLGFTVDDGSLNKFTSAIEGATLRAKLLGDALEAMARSVVKGVADAAAELNNLFFQTQRVGSSVDHIRAFEFAVKQLGGTVESANATIENFGRFMRETPGAEAFLNRMGVATRDAAGRLRDSTDILTDVGAALARMPQALAKQYADLLGIDERTRLALTRQQEFRHNFDEALKSAASAGIGAEAARHAKEFEQAFNETWQRVTDMLIGAEAKLTAALTGPLRKFNEYLDQHKDEINQALGTIAKAFGDVATKWTEGLGAVNWSEVTKDLTDFAASLAKLVTGFADLADNLRTIYGWLEKLAGWLNILTLQKGTIGNPEGGFVDQGGVGGWFNRFFSPNGWWGRTMPGFMQPGYLGGQSGFLGGGADARTYGSNQGSATPGNTGEAMRVAMDELARQGVPRENLRAAAAELVGQAMAESSLDPSKTHDNNTGYGIYGARLDRRDRMLNWLSANGYAKNSLEGQMRYMAREAMGYPRTRSVLMGATPENIIGNTGTVTAEFESPAVVNDRGGYVSRAYRTGAAGPALGSNGGVFGVGAAHAATMAWDQPSSAWAGINSSLPTGGSNDNRNQTVNSTVTNNITVSSPDPQGAATMVGSHIDRSLQDAGRNLQGAFQ